VVTCGVFEGPRLKEHVQIMTEKDWLTCSDPKPMLALLSRSPDEGELRLFHAKCCRRIWHLITDERSRLAVQTAERVAGDHASFEELATAWYWARRAVCEAKYAEWVGEAVSNFETTAEYCAHGVKLFALCAAMAAVSEKAADAHGGWEDYQDEENRNPPRWLDPPRGSDHWAAAALGELRKQQVLASGRMDDCMPIVSVERSEWLDDYLQQSGITWSWYLLKVNARAAKETARKTEMSEQAQMLREILGNSFR
jgi:hypothetical protein